MLKEKKNAFLFDKRMFIKNDGKDNTKQSKLHRLRFDPS